MTGVQTCALPIYDAVKSIEIITKAIADAVIEGADYAKQKKMDESDEIKEKMEVKS